VEVTAEEIEERIAQLKASILREEPKVAAETAQEWFDENVNRFEAPMPAGANGSAPP